MQSLRDGAKVNIALEQMGIVRLQHSKDHITGTSLLYPVEGGWAHVLSKGSGSRRGAA